MAHIYRLRRDKHLQLIEAENSWWLPPPSFLKPPTPSACVVKTVSDLFVRNPGSRDDLDNRGCAAVPRRGFSLGLRAAPPAARLDAPQRLRQAMPRPTTSAITRLMPGELRHRFVPAVNPYLAMSVGVSSASQQ